MQKTQVYNSIVSGTLDLNDHISSLTPSSQIIFYEIDLSQISPQSITISYNGSQPMNQGVLRVYNDYSLYNLAANDYGRIKWQNNFYYPFPIQAEGFEYNAVGTMPTPTVSISNLSPDYSSNSFYTYIRMQIQSLGDIVGAKFTRIKTFLKYLDGSNFSEGYNPYNPNPAVYEMELPKDIYYIDRKSIENKNVIQYQLNTILDLENLTLPSRTILGKKCPFQYRGQGCLYEYNSRLTYIHSGVYANIENSPYQVKALQTAPPVATSNEQLFIGSSGKAVFSTGDTAGRTAIFRLTGTLGNSGQWRNDARYVSGDFTFMENQGVKYYFVCTNNHTSDTFNVPPNINYWQEDACGKNISSCRLRWLKNPAFKPVIWPENRNGENYDKSAKRFYILYNTPELRDVLTGINGQRVFFPRRPGCENPISDEAHGIPKDADGNYLNGFLPFGGFPGTNKPQLQ